MINIIETIQGLIGLISFTILVFIVLRFLNTPKGILVTDVITFFVVLTIAILALLEYFTPF